MKTVLIPQDEYERLRRSDLAKEGGASAKEAAKFLGISERRVYDLRKAGTLSHAIIGGKIVFPRRALAEYLAAALDLGSVA